MKIYCKNKLPKTSRKRFLEEYFKLNQPTTYFESGKLQCVKGLNRSTKDIQALLNGSFKTQTSLKKTIKILANLLKKEKVRVLYCPDIRKYVFYNPDNPRGHYMIELDSCDWYNGKDIDDISFKNFKKYL
jgi:hypothetical protein